MDDTILYYDGNSSDQTTKDYEIIISVIKKVINEKIDIYKNMFYFGKDRKYYKLFLKYKINEKSDNINKNIKSFIDKNGNVIFIKSFNKRSKNIYHAYYFNKNREIIKYTSNI